MQIDVIPYSFQFISLFHIFVIYNSPLKSLLFSARYLQSLKLNFKYNENEIEIKLLKPTAGQQKVCHSTQPSATIRNYEC